MKPFLLYFIKKILSRINLQVSRIDKTLTRIRPELTDADKQIIEKALPYTMTSPERLLALVDAIKHIVRHNVPGDIVECGVWRGGSMMAAAYALQECGDTRRHIYLFDTFEGMSSPTEIDKSCAGISASQQLRKEDKHTGSTWCYASLDDVKNNLRKTGCKEDCLHFIKGLVEDSIPHNALSQISLLRLDTDWYESTRHELKHLFPLLSKNGILIIDDYGAWEGARHAVDEYFSKLGMPYFLHRIDSTGILVIKL